MSSLLPRLLGIVGAGESSNVPNSRILVDFCRVGAAARFDVLFGFRAFHITFDPCHAQGKWELA